MFGMRFWPQPVAASDLPTVNYHLTRSLYRSDGDIKFGSGFCKPIVDLQVGFIGIPTASTDSETQDEFLNECLHTYWAEVLQQVFRDALRDSKTVVRVRRPDIDDPLMTVAEAEHCQLEVIPPERVQIERSAMNSNVVNRAIIQHRVLFVENEGNIKTGEDPRVKEHDVIEFIERDKYRYYDKTDEKWLTSWQRSNPEGFVPVEEIYNEWDAALQDGQSEFESVLPFIRAFHDLMCQGLQAHKYHSTPKVKLKLKEVLPFIKNNFPEAVDPSTGAILPSASVDWKGREILFFTSDEDAEFLEASSILGDTKTLAEFLIDCICIASETPEWAFMRVDSGSANSDRNAQTVPFVKKIDRKRINFTKSVQNLLKMALVIQGRTPVRARLSWDLIRADDEVVYWQAFQQLVMGLETAKQSGEITDETYMKMLQKFLPTMKPTSQEKTQALKDQKKAMKLEPATNGAGNPGNVPAISGGPQGKNE